MKTFYRITLAVVGFWAGVWAADPVTIIQYPLINRPELVRPGDALSVQIRSTALISSASLIMPYKTIPLTFNSGTTSGDIRTCSAVIPTDAPFELYNLSIQLSDGKTDEARNAVRVLSGFPSAFTFVHLPDCHLPSVSWIGFYDDPNTVPEFNQILGELNLINPPFVLQTGDLVDNGQEASQFALAQELLERSRVPIFVTGGNHDLWYNGHDNWRRYFGGAMDYSFSFGPVRFIGLEMYDIPTTTYTSSQMQWLRGRLESSISASETGRIIFTHYDESRQLTPDFVDRYLVDGILFGHTHINAETKVGARQADKLNTSFTMNDNGEYRLVRVENGRITSHEPMTFRRLWVNQSPVNDGTAWSSRAEIHNDGDVNLDAALVKLHVRRDVQPFTITGGTVLQYVDYETNKRVYYVTVPVPAHSIRTVTVVGSPVGTAPPMITQYSPKYDTTIYAGQPLNLSIVAGDADTPSPSLVYSWKLNGTAVSGANAGQWTYRPDFSVFGQNRIQAEVIDAQGNKDGRFWTVYVEKSSNKPRLKSNARNFFPSNEPVVLEWIEPVQASGRLEYGPRPGQYTGSIGEDGQTNSVRFTPNNLKMVLGLYYCRIASGGLYSDEFTMVIESSQAPKMGSPVGNIKSLSPVFQWTAVPGVPYYFVILTDHKIIITKDAVTDEYSVEGANPIWAVLTTETSVPFGAKDPSGTFTSFPAPLVPGGEYYWIVLNCYGNTPELASTVENGVSQFLVDLPGSGLAAPGLLSPDAGAALSGSTIRFRWTPSTGAVGYHLYPFKIEVEEGVEVVRPIWETVINTTNTLFDFDAARRLVKGKYQWKVAAVASNGAEAQSAARIFDYDCPSATVNIRTYDDAGTPKDKNDDISLPRVTVRYTALQGVDMKLPLSTDKQGVRSGVLFAPGRYVFTAQKDNFAAARDTVILVAGDVKSLSFRLSSDPCMLSGLVTDNAGSVVTGAIVRIRHSLHPEIQKQTATNLDGQFSVSLESGPWQIEASKTGYRKSEPVSISLKSADVVNVESPLVLIKSMNQVTGLVTNASGAPVYGAIVKVGSGETLQDAATDADGVFTFSLPDGGWTIGVSKTGFTSPASRYVSVSGGQTLSLTPAFVLEPALCMISGTVTDGQAEVADAAVKAVPNSGSPVYGSSDGYGQFSMNLPSGSYRVSAEKTGHSSGPAVSVQVASDETVTGVSLTVRPASGSISGLLTTDGITPLSDALVLVDGVSQSSDAAGRYKTNVAPGLHRVTAAKTGFLVDEPHGITTAAGQAVDGVDFVLSPNASVVEGRVRDRSNGQGVAGALVRAANGMNVETLADDDGYFTLNLSAGTYIMSAVKSGFAAVPETIQIGQSQRLENRVVYLTPNTAAITGSLNDGVNPLSGTVEVVSLNLSTATKIDGTYFLSVEPSVGYRLTASSPGYFSRDSFAGPVSSAAALRVDWVLKPLSTRIQGSVTDSRTLPVEGVLVSAVSRTDSSSVLTRTDGSYQLGVSPLGGTYSVRYSKRGYGTQTFDTTTFTAGQIKSKNLVLTDAPVRLSGTVKAAGDLSPVAKAVLSVNAAADADHAVSIYSDETGSFDFSDASGRPFLWEGTFSLRASKTGFRDTTAASITLSSSAATKVDLLMEKLTARISGGVTDGSRPLPSVTIIARETATGKQTTQVTDSSGAFDFTGLASGNYRVTASLTGYTAPPETLIAASKTDLLLVLGQNTGRFNGIVTDRESGTGVVSASISISDGHGNESKTQSASDGSYNLPRLPSLYPYTISVSRWGWETQIRTGVSPLKNDTTSFSLPRIYGSISGTIRLPDAQNGVPVEGVVIEIRNGSQVFKGATDANGAYAVSSLTVGDYYVIATKPGYFTNPSSQTFSIRNQGDSRIADFRIEKAAIGRIGISGPTLLANGASVVYSYSAKDTSGRSVSISPLWRLGNTDVIDAGGLSEGATLGFKLLSDFVGPLWICLSDSTTGLSDSVKVMVQASIQPGHADLSFQDYAGASFQILAGSVGQTVSFGMDYPKPADIKRITAQYSVSGSVYSLQPSQFNLSSPMTIRIPSESEGGVVGRWDPLRLSWSIIPSQTVAGGFEFTADTLAEFAVLVPARPLGIRDLTFLPNPFSPLVQPLGIAFTPTTNQSTDLFITVRIYNMVGDLVRELWVNEIRRRDTRITDLIWDGKTDSGENALNGRYVVQIEVRDGKGAERTLKPVVLVK